MKKGMLLFSVLITVQVMGTPQPDHGVIERALARLHQSPVMRTASRSVAAIEVYPEIGSHFVFVVHLSPQGYMIVDPAERPAPIIAFSPDSSVDLSSEHASAFRWMLLSCVERSQHKLARPAVTPAGKLGGLTEATELCGPFLDTAWSQGNPYNKFCPSVSEGLKGLNDRAPTGCVPTAYAQLLHFHRWPVHGQGTHAYVDDSGFTTGAHYADFSDTYDWASMRPTYQVFNANPVATEDAVAELMQELGIAAEADYEAQETSSSPIRAGRRLAEYFFFEPMEHHASPDSLLAAMEEDLRAGLPCIVSIPGHSVVADGLMLDNGVPSFHVNFGWGGLNNGWWTAQNVAGAPLKDGTTSLRPRLMAFPQTRAIGTRVGEAAELQWILPKRREDEVVQLNIKRLELQAGNWQSDASDISSGLNSGWQVVPRGYRGDCWFAGPHGPTVLLLDEVFVPDAATDLTFWLSRRLGTATFSIDVSTDNGLTYTEVYADNNTFDFAWEHKTISLSAFAGKQVKLRLALSFGSYYPDTSGVWVDELALTSGTWYSWQFLAAYTALASRRFSEVTTELDGCDDLSKFEVNSTENDNKAWGIRQVDGVGNCFYIIPDGYGGTVDTLSSKNPISPTASTRLVLRTKYTLGTDVFRVLVSMDGHAFSQVWAGTGEVDWSDVSIDLSAYAGQALYIQLEYVVGAYFPDGIWVDSISTQEVTHPELAGQPLHYTTLPDLALGTHTLAATLVDVNGVEHGLAPSLTLTVSGD